MKTKPTLTLVASAILTCSSALAQEGLPPGTPPGGPPPPGAPSVPPPNGERGPRPPRPDGDGERGDHRREQPGQPEGRGELRGERHSREGEHPGGDRAEAPREPRPYLGVMAAPVPPPMGAQLGLSEGFGLLVMEVLPNSPAAAAGLLKYDVLKLMDDQQLVDPAQLSALVRAAGKDKQVTLTVIRKAHEQKITAKISEHMGPSRMPFQEGGGSQFPGAFRDRIHEFHEHLRAQPEGHPGPGEPGRGEGRGSGPGGPGPGAKPGASLLPEGGEPQIRMLTENGFTTVEGTTGRMMVKDRDGEIVVSTENGARVLTARGADGTVLFTGPVDTKEQRDALPAAVRAKLEAIRLRPLTAQPEVTLSNPPETLEVQ